jgi:hypothetical protein
MFSLGDLTFWFLGQPFSRGFPFERHVHPGLIIFFTPSSEKLEAGRNGKELVDPVEFFIACPLAGADLRR